MRPRYINPKLEKELVEFKMEVEDKFHKSPIRTFSFPRKPSESNGDLILTVEEVDLKAFKTQGRGHKRYNPDSNTSEISQSHIDNASLTLDDINNSSQVPMIHSSISNFKN